MNVAAQHPDSSNMECGARRRFQWARSVRGTECQAKAAPSAALHTIQALATSDLNPLIP